MTTPLLDLSPPVRDILIRATVVGNLVKLPPGRLDRKTYEAVNKALVAIGGKWNRHAGGHEFDRDPRQLVDNMLISGAVPRKNPLAFFATPHTVALRMVDMAIAGWVMPRHSLYVLEPSAGKGDIVKALNGYNGVIRIAETHAVEADEDRAWYLQEHVTPHVWRCDFLHWEDGRKGGYDLILMNPPFAVERDPSEWMAHVRKAHSLLAANGVLVAVVPVGCAFRTDRKHIAFREWTAEYGVLTEELPVGAFAESETWVNAMLLRLEAA